MFGHRAPDRACDDFELVRRWRAGQRSAQDTLLARHYGRVRRFFDLKVPAAAEDLTQQTFLACIEVLDGIERPESFKAFLFGIARNRLLRHLRSPHREDLGSSIESFADNHTSPSGIVARSKEHWLLLRAMERLPTDLRIALELYYWEDMKTSEIAAVLRVPVSTVTTRISRARKRLRGFLDELPESPDERIVTMDDLARSLVRDEPGRQPHPVPSKDAVP